MSALGEIHITLKPSVLQQGPWEEESISVGAAWKENDPLLGNTVLFLRFEVNHWDFWNISDGSCMIPSVLFKYACKAEESGFAYPSHDNIWELTLCLKASRPSISVQWINRWVSGLVHKWGGNSQGLFHKTTSGNFPFPHMYPIPRLVYLKGKVQNILFPKISTCITTGECSKYFVNFSFLFWKWEC